MELPPGTREWFNRVRGEFAQWFAPLCGKPITYLEIGCWVGGSAEWACQNLLTHPDARGFGIDPYLEMTRRHPQWQMDLVKEFAAKRVEQYRWTWLYGTSKDRLPEWNHGTIHALYIDGDHSAAAIVDDFKTALPHLAPDAIVVFDDYGVGLRKAEPTTPTACDAIMSVCGSFVRKIGSGKQFAMRLTGSPPERLEWPGELPAWNPAQNRRERIPGGLLTSEQRLAGRIQRRERWAREAAKAV